MSVDGLRPYPAYRNSGLDWLGEMPEHWDVRRGKTVFRCIDERSETGSEELLTVSSDRGIIPRDSASVTMFKARSYVGHKLCRPGDLVINSLWAWSRGLGVSRYHGIVSTAYGVYRVRRNSSALPDFIHSLVRSEAFNWELRVRSKGIWISRLQLTDASFLRAPLPLPPLAEQRAIARFLDAADRRIRRYIRAKERLIELLEERKRALVHEAVTGRIDVRTGQPYPAYKDSGIEWLGKVPEHWEVRRLGATTERLVTGTWGSDPTGRDDIVCVRVADFDRQRWGVDLREPTLRSVPLGERQGRLLAAGDLLLEKSGGGDLQPVGAVVHFDHDQEAVASNFIGRMRVRKQNSARYVLYLNSILYALRITVRSIKQTTGIQNLDVGAYLGESVPLPPPSEQTAIVGFLDAADRRILRHISATNRQIALLKEYRTRLIADVVTGKLDVREAAAGLPETDPLATNRDGTEVIPTESNLQPTAHDMAKEAVP